MVFNPYRVMYECRGRLGARHSVHMIQWVVVDAAGSGSRIVQERDKTTDSPRWESLRFIAVR